MAGREAASRRPTAVTGTRIAAGILAIGARTAGKQAEKEEGEEKTKHLFHLVAAKNTI